MMETRKKKVKRISDGMVFNSMSDCERCLCGKYTGNLSKHLQGRRGSFMGHKFEFLNTEELIHDCEWKDIDFTGGKYLVSDSGLVKNAATGYVLVGSIRDGYQHVGLTLEGERVFKTVHRLVACAFLKPDSDRNFVNHKNGDRNDNHVENLEWCTHSENIKHAYETGLIKSKIIKHTNHGK